VNREREAMLTSTRRTFSSESEAKLAYMFVIVGDPFKYDREGLGSGCSDT